MNPALENLICDVPELASCLHALDHEAVHSPDARAVLRAFSWIAQQPHSLDEKLAAIQKLTRLPPCHILIPSIRRFLDWPLSRNESA
jgi:hypothetical protein